MSRVNFSLSQFGCTARHSKTANLLGFEIVGIGILLRVMQFAADRSLWLDEAALALNIAHRSFADLLQPLDYNQGAPLGFLIAQKMLVQMFGNEDNVLRLFPLAAAIAAMPGMYIIVHMYINRLGGLFALSMFAVWFKLTYYASESKQYSVDVLASLVLLFFAYWCLEDNARPGRYIALMAAGVASMWFSHPALFTLVGIGAVLAFDLMSRRGARRRWLIGLLLLTWALNLGILYLVSLRSLAANRALIEFWNFAYMPMPPWRDPAWFSTAFISLFATPAEIGLTPALLGTLVCSLGCISLAIRNRRLAFVIMAPFLATLLASGFDKYPFHSRLLLFSSEIYKFPGDGRFLLFTLPMIALLLGEGLDRLRSLFSRLNSWAAVGLCLVAAGLLLSGPTAEAIQNLLHPYMGEDIKPVMAYIRQHMISSDTVSVDPIFMVWERRWR